MAAINFQARRAVKYDAKGRLALVGPAGGGKSYTGMTLATTLKGEGRIYALDTEHGSLSKYADLFDFDVIELDSFTSDNFHAALEAAEADPQYTVFFCDSYSHFWSGKDGALEYVDTTNKRSRDQFSGWKEWRPQERRMIDAMIASRLHVVVTLRSKTEWVESTDDKGKKKRVKIGLKPVQTDGLEYEFDFVGYLDEGSTMTVEKSRCPDYDSSKSYRKPKRADFEPFATWLKGSQRPIVAPAPRLVAARDPQIGDFERGISHPSVAPNTHGVAIGDDDIPQEMGGTFDGGPIPSGEPHAASTEAAITQANDNPPWVEAFNGMHDAFESIGQVETLKRLLGTYGAANPRDLKSGDEAKACLAEGRQIFKTLSKQVAQ